MLPAIGASPRARGAQRAPPVAATSRPAEHVTDWTPHDVAEWLYTVVRPPTRARHKLAQD